MPLGRPPIPDRLRDAILAVAAEHPGWGNRRIAAEVLAATGERVHHNTVGRYRPGKVPGQDRVEPADGPDTFYVIRTGLVAIGERTEAGADTWCVTVEAREGDVLPGSDYVQVFVEGKANARWLADAMMRTLMRREKKRSANDGR
jgi:hypothetical protein